MNLKLEIQFSKAEILHEVDALKMQMADMRPLPDDVEGRIMQTLRLQWNYHSNAIEGNKLSYNEIKAFLMEGIVAHGKPLKDHQDIRGHDEAINFLLSIVKETRSISEADIRNLHKMILVEPLTTTSGEFYHYSTPEKTPEKMQELMQWYTETSANSEIHPAVVAALFHHKFVSIHPFDNGNGPLSRILMNLILMKSGLPPVIIRLDDSQNYYSLLGRADHGDFWPFVEYITDCLKESLQMFSNWKSFRYHIRVQGIISEKSKKLIEKGFRVMGDERRTLDLFCSYSQLEIPIGATFNYFEKNNIQTLLKKEAVLIAVTQQFGKPFDVIPEGWKTISKFEFSEKDVFDLKNELPILDSWTFLDDKFYLLRIH